jgi:hypothetical protein
VLRCGLRLGPTQVLNKKTGERSLFRYNDWLEGAKTTVTIPEASSDAAKQAAPGKVGGLGAAREALGRGSGPGVESCGCARRRDSACGCGAQVRWKVTTQTANVFGAGTDANVSGLGRGDAYGAARRRAGWGRAWGLQRRQAGCSPDRNTFVLLLPRCPQVWVQIHGPNGKAAGGAGQGAAAAVRGGLERA